jgi:type IV pilus assembly protein PilB
MSRAGVAGFFWVWVVLWTAPGFCDQVYRKSDPVPIVGNVLKQDAREVQIEVEGVILKLPRETIERVVLDGQSRASAQEQAAEINRLLERGQVFGPGEALELLHQAVAGRDSIEPELGPPARRAAERSFFQLKELHETGNFTLLFQRIEQLTHPGLLPAWKQAFPGNAFNDEYRRLAQSYEAIAHLLRAESRLAATRELDSARSDFTRATQLLGPQDFLAGAYLDLRSYRRACYGQLRVLKVQLQTLPEAVRRQLATSISERDITHLFAEARRDREGDDKPVVYLDEIVYRNLIEDEQWFRNQGLIYRVVMATPGPTPPPVVRVLSTPASPSEPVPEPESEPPPKETLKETLAAIKSGKFAQAVANFKNSLGGYLQYAIYALYALGALILWIGIPRWILHLRERRGDIHAAHYRQWSRFLAPIALGAYLVKMLATRPRRAKHRCPFCGCGLDDMEAYADLNFMACPNCHQTITPVYDLEDYIEFLVGCVKRDMELSKIGAMSLKAIIEKDAMSKLVRSIITLAVRRRASDLHVEPDAEGLKIRVRVDGMLQELTSMPKPLASPLVSALKVLGNLDIAERRVPQDGRFQIWVDKADVDIRIASAPAALGEKCSLRLLDSRTIQVDPLRLGMEDSARDIFERTIRKPHGLVLVTGPTGSGKSTTLYVALQMMNTGERNIISIEDPIEFKIKGVNQMQVNPQANFTFATGMRSILRQDPDVIMVGEIRDEETADIAIEAAMTGHLVLSTLHTIDSASAIGRLMDLGVEPRRFGDALQLIIAQRLMRLNCTQCAAPYKPKNSELEALGIKQEEMSGDDWKPMKGAGCNICRFTGFFGRVGLFEMFVPNTELRALIEQRAGTNDIRNAALATGLMTLRTQGLERARTGLTPLEEVLRVTA